MEIIGGGLTHIPRHGSPGLCVFLADVNILNSYRGKCIYRMHVYLLHIIDIICIDSTRFQPRSLPSATKFDFNSVSVSISVSVALGLCFMIEHLDIPLLSGQPPWPAYGHNKK